MTNTNARSLDSTIGAVLKEQRLMLNVRQEELAQALGVTRATITRYETGQRRITVAALLEIANALGVPASSLLPRIHQRNEQAPTGDPVMLRVLAALGERPDLLPTVEDLIATLLHADFP